jgi:thiamine transporter ThiT
LNALGLFLLLDLALVTGAAVLLLLVIIRRGRSVQYLALAALLIALAVGVWYTTIRSPASLP